MAKFEKPFETTKEIFDNQIKVIGLYEQCKIDIVTNNRLKEIFKVTKANDYVKFKTGFDVTIFLNEQVFEFLEEHQRQLIVEESLAYIFYNDEKGTVEVKKPDVKTFSGVLSKFTYDQYSKTQQVIKETMAQLKDSASE